MFSRLRPSPAMAVAVAALFLSLGGVGVAATNGTFILGNPNTADQTTALTGSPVAGAALSVANSTAKQPAAAFTVTGKTAPFTVSSTTKVGKLNADLLDGVDSTGFVAGSNTQILSNRLVFVPPPAGGVAKTLLTLPGLGTITAQCFNNSAQIIWSNTTQTNIDYWSSADSTDDGLSGGVGTPSFDVLLARYPFVGSHEMTGGTAALGIGNDPGARQIAIIHAFSFQSAVNAPCGFQAEVTLWRSP